jgi:uncharacterized protein
MVSHIDNEQHPGTARPRSDFVDILRGVALIGICVVNLPMIALPLMGDDTPVFGPADMVGSRINALLFEAKFFPIFSLLFGYGFAVLLARIEAGAMTVQAYRRRLFGLFLLGVLHALLLFSGDILITYAFMGMVLWRLRGAADRKLLRIALWTNLAVGGLLALITLTLPMQPVMHWTPAMEATRAAFLGDFASVWNQRLSELPFVIAAVFLLGPMVMGSFALGLVAGRRDLLNDPAALLALIRPHLRWLIPLAIVGNGLYAAEFWLPDALAALAMVLSPVAGLALATLYIAGIAALVRASPAFPGLFLLRQAGRMSLSNYLCQSLVANALFLGWGFGLYGQLDRLALIPVSLAIAGALILLSALWLQRFRIGPLEWLLRCWTDLSPVPLRRASGPQYPV